MSLYHLVRVGTWAEVGRFQAVDATHYPRGSRVVLRTARGLELGEVLAPPERAADNEAPGDGVILRGVTPADDLLALRLQRNRAAAIEACEAAIRERQLPVSLVDAEPLFDGRTLVFYFLGEPSAELDQLTERLAEVYEGQVQFRRFAEAVNTGCGPGCGTTAATGGCGNCAEQGCTIASACAASNGAGKRA
ncbi:MAG: hypothetical protein K1X74_16230 [Pirellulales bacterium]|nr:hypothetical protein [Pirellulales bacterium]